MTDPNSKIPYNPHDARVKEEPGLRIMNASRGIRNYVNKHDFFNIMEKVFGEIAKNLTNHCGPYSRSALVISPSGGKYETNVFTRDGRNIVNSMNFVSPIEEIIKDMLLYIGSRVDNKAGDGTTSSMFIASSFFESIANKYKHKIVNSKQFVDSYNKFNDLLKTKLDEQRITLDDCLSVTYSTNTNTVDEYQQMVAYIAAMQALSSSGGDVELATAMYDIYLQSPPGTWDYVAIYHNRYENTKRYEAGVDSYDHWLEGHILTPTLLNENLYSEYKNKVDLLVIPEKIPGGGLLADNVDTFLKEIMKSERDKDLVIFCRNMDPVFLRKVNDFNNESETFKICVFDHLDELSVTAVSMGLIGLSLSGGVDPYITGKSRGGLTTDYLIKSVEIHYKNHKIYVNDLFDKHEDPNGIVHPFYRDSKRFQPFTFFVVSLQKRLNMLKEDINQTQYQNEIDAISNTIGRMCFPRRPFLYVGGSSHDHAEALDVIRDVCGAINSSLTKGFICGSSFALFRAIMKAKEELINGPVDADVKDFMNFAADAVIELINITKHGYEKSIDNAESLIDNGCKYLAHSLNKEPTEIHISKLQKCISENDNKFSYINILHNFIADESSCVSLGECILSYMKDSMTKMNNNISKEEAHEFIKNIADPRNMWYPILQPSTVFEQLFCRIGELMLKLITTECVIVPGAVYVKDSDIEN